MQVAIIGTISSSMVSFRGPLLQALVDGGHNVYAFAIDYDEETEMRIRAFGAQPVRYRMDRTGTHPLRDLRSTWELVQLLRQRRIDLVLSYFAKPVVYGSIAAVVAGVSRRYALLPGLGYAFTDTGSAPSHRQRLLASLLTRMLRFALTRNERLFLYNSDDVADVKRLRLVDPEKITRINGTGIDLTAYQPAPPVIEPITFLLAARLIAEKGIREYAAAARIVKRQYPQVQFVLLGGLDTNPGALSEPEVKAWAEEGLLEWLGSVPDVQPWLERSSVYVLPSYYREGVPRSTQEAMAKGRPIITTDAVGCRETVIDGQNGFLVPVRNPEALATAMIRFIKEPHIIDEMGRASRKLAEARFDVHQINARILKVLEEN